MLQPRLPALLCVDPDPEVHGLVSELLREHRLTFANNAFEGLRELHNGVHDAYLLEQRLPDWSGVQLCRQIRRIDPHGPILFCTVAGRPQDRAHALRAGASGYLGKPIDPQKLRNELSTQLELTTLESIEARIEAQRATESEIASYASEALKSAGMARSDVVRSVEGVVRSAAAVAFMKSGGTRANFERWWPSLFAAALAHYQLLDNFPLFW